MAAKCPDLHQFRSENVLSGIDFEKITGDWYEVAYEDIAQAGAKCQKFTNTKTDAGLEQQFHAKYVDKLIPFTQTYEYEADDVEDPDEIGMYSKYLKGASLLLTLPTVIVDLTGDDNQYEYMIEFTCKNESSLVEVTELRFSSRYMSISDEQFASMKQTAIDAGIDESIVNSVALADQSRCQLDDELVDQEKVDRMKNWAKDQAKGVIDWWNGNSFLQ